MDLLPTVVHLAGGEIPQGQTIDGKNIWTLISGAPHARSPHSAIFYLRGRGVQAIREGDWKYRAATDRTGREKSGQRKSAKGNSKRRQTVETLINLKTDPGEQHNVIVQHADIAARLKQKLADFQQQLRSSVRSAGVAESADGR